MTPELMRAATELCEALATENRALAAVDFAAAAALLDTKRAAAGQFAAAHARQEAAGFTPAASPRDVAAIAQRLAELAAENKKLLERAIAAQRRVIGSIAKAAPKPGGRAPRYDRRGALADTPAPAPVALLSRA